MRWASVVNTLDMSLMVCPRVIQPASQRRSAVVQCRTARLRAKIVGNTIFVHFEDGVRGDGDLDGVNGVIKVSPVGAAINLQADAIENAAPNKGDANGDYTLDSLQGDVASLPDINGAYVTLQTDAL